MPLSTFQPIIRDWFNSRFEGPTDAQAEGWPAISQGQHTLISAPTGSGKTLAAFLTCIDDLVSKGMGGCLPETTQVVYVSPLKALSNDIQKNLAIPLEELQALATRSGVPFPEIRTAVRTGDTPGSERRKMTKTPPHILITTPESLYILLTSESGRAGLKGVRTIILDEIHAVAGNKRGSHLALSVERLCDLAEGPVTRIGLSATQRPIEEMARLLVGSSNTAHDGTPDCTIVDTGHARKMDIDILLPERELGPIATHELWDETLNTVAELVRSHETTLVFVNTRRLVERVAHQLSERLGEGPVVAHHGSLSRATRLSAEEKLKKGEVRVCVATASLELGIDIGVVDLVCQIGSPRSIGLLLQRIGRSGHSLGGTPKGRLFPLTRDELVECIALSKAVRNGILDTLKVPAWPLDVLAQQIVASCAAEEWDEDELYALCKRAHPYRELPRDKYDQVVGVLAQGFAPRQGRTMAFLHRDGVNHRLRGRRGARIAALTSGGAIPDNADYDVIAEPEGTFVGTVNEDFAIESMAGDVFLLGNTPWKIKRVESGRVRVQDAQGLAPTIPFWLGEAPGRTWELSEEVSKLREAVDQRLQHAEEAARWTMDEAGVSQDAAQQLVAYLEEGKRVLGMVPTAKRVVAERFFDESGGMQVVVHAPFGARLNRAWGMALRKRICRTFDLELQASATDDGLNFSLGPQLSFPLEEIFTYLSERTVEEVLRAAMLQAPLFGTRWRWNATRALGVLRHTGGKKVPSPLLRMRSDDLLAAVFPAQVQCQDNAPAGNIEVPDHPLVFETMRDCLTEASDLEGLKWVLAEIETGGIEVYARDTVQPSAFSHQILNAMPYAFLDDAPLEERRARAVALRRALPEDSRDLAALEPAAILEESKNAWPWARDEYELHDSLLLLGILPEDDVAAERGGSPQTDMEAWFENLVQSGRAFRLRHREGSCAWIAAENVPLAMAAYPESVLEPAPPRLSTDPSDPSHEDAVLSLIRGRVECYGPFVPSEFAGSLNLSLSDLKVALVRLESQGLVLRGRFRPGVIEDEYCDRRILARIHRATISGLRKQVEPVAPATFIKFLFRWQHADSPSQLQGESGVLQVVETLQGFEAPAGAWESELLPCRISDYKSSDLDRLCTGGEVVWGRVSKRQENGNGSKFRGTSSRNTPITFLLRESLGWQVDPANGAEHELSGAAQEVLEYLARKGASFPPDIVASTRRLPSDVDDALWQLVASGRVTADSLEALRVRIKGKQNGRRRPSKLKTGVAYRRPGYGRWSLLEPASPQPEPIESRARQLLKRYGLLCPELLFRETTAPRWRELVRVLRLLEARGEIRGGRFVAGFVGEQFALPEAVELLRKVKNDGPQDELVSVSACDPLNVVGILTPGEKVPAVLGNRVVFKDGVPICSLENGDLVDRSKTDEAALASAHTTLQPLSSKQRVKTV